MRLPRLKPLGYVVLLALLSVVLYPVMRLVNRNWVERTIFDLTHHDPYVGQRTQVRELLEGFPTVAPKDLPAAFRASSGMNRRAFKDLYHGRHFFKVSKKDLYRRIAGNNRLMSVVSADNGYRREWIWSDKEFYVYIDRKVLYLLLDIQDALTAAGLDRDALRIISGHRTPGHNNSVGGKSESRHLSGDALDIMIGDLNRDGAADRNDKKLLIPILNRQVGNRGGLGVYRMSVHIDVRGHRARW